MRMGLYVTGLVKSSFYAQIQIFKNANVNYLKYCILAKDTDTCIRFTMILLYINRPTIEWIAN